MKVQLGVFPLTKRTFKKGKLASPAWWARLLRVGRKDKGVSTPRSLQKVGFEPCTLKSQGGYPPQAIPSKLANFIL